MPETNPQSGPQGGPFGANPGMQANDKAFSALVAELEATIADGTTINPLVESSTAAETAQRVEVLLGSFGKRISARSLILGLVSVTAYRVALYRSGPQTPGDSFEALIRIAERIGLNLAEGKRLFDAAPAPTDAVSAAQREGL